MSSTNQCCSRWWLCSVYTSPFGTGKPTLSEAGSSLSSLSDFGVQTCLVDWPVVVVGFKTRLTNGWQDFRPDWPMADRISDQTDQRLTGFETRLTNGWQDLRPDWPMADRISDQTDQWLTGFQTRLTNGWQNLRPDWPMADRISDQIDQWLTGFQTRLTNGWQDFRPDWPVWLC